MDIVASVIRAVFRHMLRRVRHIDYDEITYYESFGWFSANGSSFVFSRQRGGNQTPYIGAVEDWSEFGPRWRAYLDIGGVPSCYEGDSLIMAMSAVEDGLELLARGRSEDLRALLAPFRGAP